MAVTITAYQGLGGPFRLTRTQANPSTPGKTITWDPSNQIVRDGTRENMCLLSWMVRTMSGSAENVRMNILFDGQETAEIEEVFLPDGKVCQTISTSFMSKRADLSSNRIVFNLLAGFGDLLISDYFVFYKRRVEGV